MSEHVVYDGPKGHNIVGQSKSTLYKDYGVEALEKIIDLHFIGYEWILVASWGNGTNNTHTYEQTYLSELRIKSGQEYEEEWSLTAGYKNLEFGIGSSTKHFTEEETTKSHGYKVTVNVGPNSSVYFYQKRYKFNTEVWFRLDAWNKLWTVGKWQAAGVATLDATVDIDSNEYLTKTSKLSGRGNITVAEQSGILTQDNVKRFEECTDKCQSYLHNRGV